MQVIIQQQASSQEFAKGGGGLFRRLETTANDLDPDFGRSSFLVGIFDQI